MTDLDGLKTLRILTDLAYQRDLAGLQPLLKREQELRNGLARLADQAAEARTDKGQFELMRPLGADVLWEKWLSRNWRDLNQQLAVVLAQKEARMDGLRRSFGRAEVAQTLVKDAELEKQRNKSRKSWDLSRQTTDP